MAIADLFAYEFSVPVTLFNLLNAATAVSW